MTTQLHLAGGDKPFASIDLPHGPRVGERIQFDGQDSSWEIVGLTYCVQGTPKPDLNVPLPTVCKLWVRSVRF